MYVSSGSDITAVTSSVLPLLMLDGTLMLRISGPMFVGLILTVAVVLVVSPWLSVAMQVIVAVPVASPVWSVAVAS